MEHREERGRSVHKTGTPFVLCDDFSRLLLAILRIFRRVMNLEWLPYQGAA